MRGGAEIGALFREGRRQEALPCADELVEDTAIIGTVEQCAPGWRWSPRVDMLLVGCRDATRLELLSMAAGHLAAD